MDETTDLFEVRSTRPGAYRQARNILTQYIDQSCSVVDAVVFTIANDDPAVDQILTVDGRDVSIYRFAHSGEVVVP